jgi:hypothetical protein
MALTEKERNKVCEVADRDGLDYAFTDFSEWPEIKDKKFHELRIAYKKASDALLNYIKLDKWLIEESNRKGLGE